MNATDYIRSQFGPNSGYIEELYAQYQQNPGLVGDTWAEFFSRLPETGGHTNGNGHHAEPAQLPISQSSSADTGYSNGYYNNTTHDSAIQERIYRMISAFRSRGHLRAQINPLTQGVKPLPETEDTNIDFYRFTDDQLALEYNCSGLAQRDSMALGEIIDHLHRSYCGSIGFEFVHLLNQEERLWLQEKIERRFEHGYRLSNEKKVERLKEIINAESFEAELHKKYVGHKRFSLQGAETLIPMIDMLIEDAAESSIQKIVFGMPHRGRLNVLANTLNKPLADIFSEFEDQNIHTALGSGDVKYHMGYETEYLMDRGQKVKLQLCPNPSHLEFVNPVVEGIARGLQDFKHNKDRGSVLPVLLHGDAAFAGQGVVFETINMSGVTGYATGGTVHIVVNNQIGFTTNPDESRSSTYCTDMAKAVQAPVFHVNCEDVESACWAIRIALEFRNRYGRDVILDLYGYRRYGHNEGDDPSFTQPIIYSEIKEKKTIATLYAESLVEEGVVTKEEVQSFYDHFKQRFEDAHSASKESNPIGEACSVHGKIRIPCPETGVAKDKLQLIASTLVNYPENFVPHPKLKKILEKRVETLETEQGIDWGFAESLAIGSLQLDGCRVRLSGQDSERGTFSQRHLALADNTTGVRYYPFDTLSEKHGAAEFEVVNSTLSEASVVGFEFGYSTVETNSLVMWEAQFGDFANGAQVAMDQFISSSEAKWGQRSGVTLLLPHGYEGQGPEHSSARLERYLQLCAEGNMLVCYPTTAFQHFHLLRRQGLNQIKRPLVIMTPKSLLRHAGAACTTGDLTAGRFQRVLVDDFAPDNKKKHVACLSGKVYYDILSEFQAQELEPNVVLLRLEQLYRFPEEEIASTLEGIDVQSLSWIQEEPRNMGAWSYVQPLLKSVTGMDPQYVGRPESASTATGSAKRHAAEQKRFIDELISIIST